VRSVELSTAYRYTATDHNLRGGVGEIGVGVGLTAENKSSIDHLIPKDSTNNSTLKL